MNTQNLERRISKLEGRSPVCPLEAWAGPGRDGDAEDYERLSDGRRFSPEEFEHYKRTTSDRIVLHVIYE